MSTSSRLAGLALLGGLLLATVPIEPARPSYAPRWGRPYVMPFDTVEGHPKGAEATRVGWQTGQVTPTACPWWESDMRQPHEPVPWCMSTVLNPTFETFGLTVTAGIADGSYRDWYASMSWPPSVPTLVLIGTWTADARATVAPTWTALAEQYDRPGDWEAALDATNEERRRDRGRRALVALTALALLAVVAVALTCRSINRAMGSLKP